MPRSPDRRRFLIEIAAATTYLTLVGPKACRDFTDWKNERYFDRVTDQMASLATRFPETPENIFAQKLMRSTYMISPVETRDGCLPGASNSDINNKRGSATLIEYDESTGLYIFLTAAHLLNNTGSKLVGVRIGKPEIGLVANRSHVLDCNSLASARHDSKDIMLIGLRTTTGLPCAYGKSEICEKDDVVCRVGDRVVAASYPNICNQPIVTFERNIIETTDEIIRTELLGSKGSSGASLANPNNGDILGVLSRTESVQGSYFTNLFHKLHREEYEELKGKLEPACVNLR